VSQAREHRPGEEAKAGVDHSTAGGLYGVQRFGKAGRLLAYIAAGHHAGLPD